MKTTEKVLAAVVIALVFLLCSCEESLGTGNLKITLETTNQTRSLRPDDKSSLIVKYNIRGVGPGGKTFSRDSASKTITVEGLTMGVWTISATGYNSESNGIVSGSKTFEFNSSNTSVTLSLNSYNGSGSLQVDLKWNKEISDPRLEIILEHNGKTEKETYYPESKSCTYQYLKNGLQAGSYMLKAIVYNNDNLVTGLVESVQIVNNRTTAGTVELLSPGEASSKSSGLYIEDQSGFSVTAHLAIPGSSSLPTTLEANKNQIVNLVLDSSLTGSENYTVSWFIDGQAIGQKQKLSGTNSVTVNPNPGYHIISIFAENPKTGLSGSMYYRFNAKTSAKTGSASFVSVLEADRQSKIILAEDSLIGSLPDDHFIIITPSRSSIQVVSVFNNSVLLSANQTYNATDLRFPWISQTTGLYSNPSMNFFAVVTENNCLHLLYYNRTTEKIELAQWNEEPVILSGFVKMPPCYLDNIATVSFVPSSDYSGTIFVIDSGERSEEILSITTTANEIKKFGTSVREKEMKNSVCAAGFGNVFAVLTSDGKIKFTKIQDGSVASQWSTFADDNLLSSDNFFFLNQQFAAFRKNNSIMIYEYYQQQKMWVHKTSVNIDSNSFSTSLDGAFIYIGNNESGLITYKSGLTDNMGKLFTQSVENTLTETVSNQNHVIGRDSKGNLYIFEIIRED